MWVGFEGAERLSLAVTSRDFRVRGRHANVNRQGELEAGKLQHVTRENLKLVSYSMLHQLTCITYNYKTLHVLHVITAII